MRLVSALVRYVEEHRLGVLFPQDTGFKLTSDPDTVRAPDLAFVGREIALIGFPEGFWPGAPDLAVEVRSPDNSMRDLAEKAREYLRFGSRLVWIRSPPTEGDGVPSGRRAGHADARGRVERFRCCFGVSSFRCAIVRIAVRSAAPMCAAELPRFRYQTNSLGLRRAVV
jgi:Uma2 family endonuclease